MTETFIAFAQGPTDRIWEDTAVIAVGRDAEHKARRLVEHKLWKGITAGLLRCDPPYDFSDMARESGFKIVVLSVEVPLSQ